MSLKRKLTLDDDDVAQDSVSVVLPQQASAVSAARTVSSSASSPSPPSSSSSATAKRPRLHDHHASASRPPPRHQHSSQRLQRPTDSRPRSSSAPCPSTLRTPSDKFIYPPWTPDVTRESLRSLDLDVLQSNVQFRHDFMLDGPHKFTRVIPKPKRDDMTRYWLAVLIELETGCTCVAFDDANKVWPCVCPTQPTKMPSRVLPMLAELRALIRHVTAPARASTPSDSDAPDHLALLLDERRILDAIRLGVYDYPSLFRFIGHMLKEHCAPMRDARIDAMVSFATAGPPQPASSSVVKSHILQAIRMCFDVVELMAMDIANHQLLTFRPRLLSTTASVELAAFSTKFRLHDTSALQIACTQSSMQRALDAVKQSPAAAGTAREHLLRTSLSRAVVDLIFSPAILAGPRAPGLRIPADFPETLYLDHSRLCRFGMEAADLTVLYMVLLLARSPPFGVTDTESAVQLKNELASISPPRLGLCFGHPLRAARHSKSSSHSDPASVAAKMSEEHREWRAGVSDVLLQVARRASPGSGGIPAQATIDTLERWADSNLREGTPFATVLQRRLKDTLVEAVDAALRSPSPAAMQPAAAPAPMYAAQPCAQALMQTATRQPSPMMTSPQAPALRLPVPRPAGAQTAPGAGLEPLEHEINTLARRISDVVSHHWNVYNPVYNAPGFLL